MEVQNDQAASVSVDDGSIGLVLCSLANIFADDDQKTNYSLPELIVLIDQLVQQAQTEDKKIIIHCREGKSRSTTALINYLFYKNGGSKEEILKELKKQRNLVQPNNRGLRGLYPYRTEKQLPLLVAVHEMCKKDNITISNE